MSRITISLALVLILAAPAHAGTIELRPGATDSSDSYVFTAAPGERNDIVVEDVAGAIRVRDAAGRPAGCIPEGADAVRCPRVSIEISMQVDAGDGDDTVTGDAALRSADGGPGNDRLATTDPIGAFLGGGEGDDTLAGGPGMDTVSGGPGSDRVSGGSGNDQLSEFRDRQSDVLDGGEGEDTVSYVDRTRPVRVDLASGRGGESGEGDHYVNVENAVGGKGQDLLLGDAGRNELRSEGRGDRVDGRGGDDLLTGTSEYDVLRGGAGADTLSGEGGADFYDGGPGPDRLFLDLQRRPIVRCGDGADVVWGGADARLHPDCERVRQGGARIRITRRALRLRYETAEYAEPCRVRAKFAARGRVLERRTLRTFPVTIPLPARRVRVTLHASSRCRGRFGDVHDVITFRLTS